MRLVERHIIRRSDSRYKAVDHACWLAKNLYNAGLYAIKQEFLRSGKWARWMDLNKEFVQNDNPDYRALSANSSNRILKRLDENIKSYFGSIKAWKRDNKKFTGCPKFPRYKDKERGRAILSYAYNQISHKGDVIKLPKKEGLGYVQTRCPEGSVKEVRFVPRPGYYVCEVCYEVADVVPMGDNGRYMSVDLGLGNLATCFSTVSQSFIVNGRPLKSINQYYNKRRASIQSVLEKENRRKSSKRLDRLTLRRNNKVRDYLHKASKRVIRACVENNINTLIVGYNEDWKRGIALGRRTNQSFVCVPHGDFVGMLRYKCMRLGLRFVEVNESHTSKCSSIDGEAVCHHEVYMGSRVRRGLYRSSRDGYLNADINGAVNIMRKAVGDGLGGCLFPADRGFWRNPVRINADKYVSVQTCI